MMALCLIQEYCHDLFETRLFVLILLVDSVSPMLLSDFLARDLFFRTSRILNQKFSRGFASFKVLDINGRKVKDSEASLEFFRSLSRGKQFPIRISFLREVI